MRIIPIAVALVAALGLAAVTPEASDAQDIAPSPAKDAQARRMVAAFDAWVAKYGVANASLAVMRDDKVVGQAKAGGHTPTAAQPLASLSKGITGVCIVKLVDAGKLKYGDKLGRLIPDYFKRNKPADQAAKQITVAQLLTQTSGMHYDPTQGTAGFAALDFKKKNMPEQLKLAFEQPLASKTHYYNNVNFLALGMIIEAVTKTAYDTHCGKSVLKAAGVQKPKLDPDLLILSSYGGWLLSAVDYVRFAEHFRPAAKLMKSKWPSWPKSPPFSSGSHYMIGEYTRTSGASYNFWHSGAFYWNEPARFENFGAFFAMFQENLRYAATYSPQPPAGAVGELDYAMFVAAFPASAGAREPVAVTPLAPGFAGGPGGTDTGVEDAAIARSYEAPLR